MADVDVSELFAAWETAQPYPGWAEARQECPVHQTPQQPWSERPSYEIVGYDAVVTALRDWPTFSSAVNAEHIGRFMGELMLAKSGQEHRDYRALVAHAFRPSAIARWDEELVRPIITEIVDRIAPAGSGDLVREITSQYPVRVICGIVGVPAEDTAKFHAWADQINNGPINPEPGLAASQAMRDYLEPLVAERRARPNGDLLSELVEAEVDGERLTDELLYGFLRLLLPAGAETTYRAMGNCLAVLLTHPDVIAAARRDHDVIDAVIEETLRWESSVTTVSRVTTRDTELAGCPIPEGAMVAIVTGAANRDPAHFDDPDTWRLDRGAFHHLAFSTGPHQCLGMHLARAELRTGLTTIVERLPGLRLDPAFPPPVIQGSAFRGPDALHARWD